jgi:glycosyltransferase involved in cell wall biosynthesis
MYRDLISVVMPVYNKAEFLCEAVSSVQKQTYERWELILVDDGSEAGCQILAEKLANQDSRILLEKNPDNMGVSYSRNKALKLCRGTYVAFLDADDYWDSSFLAEMLHFAKMTNADFSYCSYCIVSEKSHQFYHAPPKAGLQRALIKSPFACLSVLIKIEKLGSQLYFNETLKTHEDFDLWLRLLQVCGTANGCQKTLAYYRQVPNSASSNKLRNVYDRWRYLRHHANLGNFQSQFYLFCYLLFGLLKYYKVRSFKGSINN